MSKKVAEVIVETLQSAGVKNCYGIVGDWIKAGDVFEMIGENL